MSAYVVFIRETVTDPGALNGDPAPGDRWTGGDTAPHLLPVPRLGRFQSIVPGAFRVFQRRRLHMSDGIEGKVVLITGGSTGLGAETARLLAARGAKVAVAARRKDKLDDVVAAIVAAGGTAKAYALDVTDKAQIEAVVAAVVAGFGRLDVLVNNAGVMPIRPMSEVNTDEWDQMIDVNLKGVLYGIAAVLPRFLTQESGHIINLSSVAGIKVFAPGGTVYSGTKFAVSAISEGLRQEVGDKVRVTSIKPGAVESDLKLGTSGTATETVLDFYKQAIPATSVARAIAFAIEQPANVDVNAIVLRPTSQQF